MLVKRKTCDGVEVPIEVYADGEFRAEFDDETYRAKTLVDLEALLDKAVAKKQVARPVDVTLINLVPRPAARGMGYDDDAYTVGRGVVHAKLRKRAERIGKFLLTAGDGTKFQLSSYSGGVRDNICRRLTDDEVARYLQLARFVDDAEADLEAFRVSVAIDPDEALGRKR